MEYWEIARTIEFLGNTVQDYLLSLGTLILIFIVFRVFVYFLISQLRKIAKKSKNKVDDAVVDMFDKIRWMIFMIISVAYIDITLTFPVAIERNIDALMTVIIVLLMVAIVNYWISFGISVLESKKIQASERFSIQFVGRTLKFFSWVIGILFLISSFGYNISSLVAGLGVGGIAVALAVQNILSDVFSSISIQLDKPFKVGDFIIVGQEKGTVKKIGLKTTRITSLQGEEIVMSNKVLTESNINNYGKMKKRRVLVSLGVTYDTPGLKMKKIPDMLKKIVKSVKDTTFDRAHFKEFGDFSKNVELVFYIESNDYYTYMDRLEEINLNIQKTFERNKIEFAFPSQTIYLKK